MMRSMTALVITAFVLTASACSPTSPSYPGRPEILATTPTMKTASGTVTAVLNGQAFSADSDLIKVGASNGVFALQAVGPSGGSRFQVSFSLAAGGPGSYAIPGSGTGIGNSASLASDRSSWAANNLTGSGTIEITSLTPTSAAGTFSLTLQPTATGAVGTYNVAAGTFNVIF